MGVRVGDAGESLRERFGEPDSVGHVGSFVVYGPVEFSLGTDGRVEMIYVEVPDEVDLRYDELQGAPEPSASADPDTLITQVGHARLCLDRSTLHVTSFAL